MAQPMLQITAAEATTSPARVRPNLLPCRIHHTGPVGSTELYWTPKSDGEGENAKETAYFRGRKLCGHTVRVPEGYRGVVGERRASPQEDARQRNEPDEVIDVDSSADEQAAQRQQAATGRLAVLGEFDEMVIWGHQSAPDTSDDAYVRSMTEWLEVAEQIHSYDKEGDKDKEDGKA